MIIIRKPHISVDFIEKPLEKDGYKKQAILRIKDIEEGTEPIEIVIPECKFAKYEELFKNLKKWKKGQEIVCKQILEDNPKYIG